MLKPLLTTVTLLLFTLCGFAGENAAPSSHMVYNDASFDGDILINEVRVPKNGEAMYTYYEALGWGGRAGGYAGIQAHPKAHNYIFSIWDHKEHTAPIKAVYHGPGTLTENFGGEGTGLKSWNFELGWDTDVWYTLVSRCWPVDDHTLYGYWVRSSKSNEWTHMVTMDVATKGAYFKGGNDSFIEDWLETGKKARTTHIRNGWKRKPTGEWHAFGKARYSVNSWDLVEGKRSFNFKTNWNGGVAKDKTGEFYFMTSGGADTQATATNPSSHSIKRSETKPGYAPAKILSASVKSAEGNTVNIEWKLDPKSAPQFSIEIAGKNKAGTAVLEKLITSPDTRSVTLEFPKGIPASSLSFEIRCRDIFDNESKMIKIK